MTSRLERLFILLETGSSNVTRQAAANQIGEVQKLYPNELHNLLNRLIGYLRHSSWDTRIAAAQAVNAILKNVPKWDPIPSKVKTEQDDGYAFGDNELRFDKFDLVQVLQKGARLMGSEGTEFDFQDEEMNKSDRLRQQRAMLNEKLGFSVGSKLGIDCSDIVSLDDMVDQSTFDINKKMVPVQDILQLDRSLSQDNNGHNLSSREINRAKRKARQQITACSSSLSRNNSTTDLSLEEPEKKKPKPDETKKFEIFYDLNEPVPESSESWGDCYSWPLQKFCSVLYVDLFNSKWEVRHGAATALRELINLHSSGGGKFQNMTKEEMDESHSAWLEDATLRLLCVLSLDRFGDFVSDQVVAPVRETCAQVLGTILKEMSKEKVYETIKVLLSLIKQAEWEVRHGGLLGLKYALIVREDLLQTVLPLTINHIFVGLFDSVDDVGAVAAATLIPVTSWFPELLTPAQVSNIVKMLWNLLLDQDELTSACNSFMGLLAAIVNLPNSSQWIEMEPMPVLIPRLWPFLSHNTSSVRRSTLQTLKTLTQNAAEKTDDSKLVNNVNGNGSLSDNIDVNSDSNNLQLNFCVKSWTPQLLQEALRHVYQRVLIEPLEDIQELSKEVWINLVTKAELSALLHAACPYVASWICLAMQPPRLAFDISNLIIAKPLHGRERRNRLNDESASMSATLHQRVYLGGTEGTPAEIRKRNVIKARINAANILGLLSHYLVQPAPGVVYTEETESPIDCYTKVLLGYLQSRSSLQRLICGMIISFWALSDPSMHPGPPVLQEKLKYCVMEYVYYDEVAISFTRLLQEARDFIATLKQYKVPITEFDNQKILTLNQIQLLATTMTVSLKQKCALKQKTLKMLEERRDCLHNSFLQTNAEQNSHNISTQASLAGAIVCMRCLPEKLNPVIKPLMESIKKEECEMLQKLSAEYLAHLLDQIWNREPNPNSKIITNLCALLKSDTDFTPKIIICDKTFNDYFSIDDKSNPYYGSFTLSQNQKSYEPQNSKASSVRPSTSDGATEETADDVESVKKLNRIQRIGATYAISTICKHFGEDLNTKIPTIWTIMYENIVKYLESYPSMENLRNELLDQDRTNDLMTSLQLIEIAVPHFHLSLHDSVYKLLPNLRLLLTHPLNAIRHMVTRCFAALANINDTKVMHFVVENIVPYVHQIENIIHRQGAVETINLIVERLQFKVVPYVVLLIVPLLGRMSDPDESVRLMSTHCFATLIQLMPLDSTNNGVTKLSKDLQERKTRDSEFLEFLFSPKTIPDYKVPVPINAELRSYQQAGVNWLWFLNKYNLHGILCDDMGLGKTLQTICILAGDHYQRAIDKLTPLPSIVVCPPTLSGHWFYEVTKFMSSKYLAPLCYVGFPNLREKLRNRVGPSTLVITSYDTIRKEVDFFGSIHWNYCVLDEGHVIKNGKTKTSKAIKQIKANHRLILSGTPIQNNVLELWSLFDFLMPGFLGTEKQFTNKFSRPILMSRDPKSSSKEQEAGVLAMEALHRQVLPFLLRRVKEDVLRDLPPKITQDLLCELSPLQERLYEDFNKTHLKSEIKDCLENLSSDKINRKGHIFQALRYLQKVCNHPKLVLNANHPEYNKIQIELAQKNRNLDDIEHAAKLPLLKQLLLDCGIGAKDVPVSQHRALIFCQLRSMLDIIENDLLKKHLPSVSYLRLDGNVPASMRHSVVTKFNQDPSIDILLLTTLVGGLGLNLTGADTVIFVEHDWNPMKDIQAMDRAHRIGQRKVVNVYRLITRKSLEEKIMGLQKFKIATANTIVSSENASMETMKTDQLLDLFNLCENAGEKRKDLNDRGNQSIQSIIDNLPELWEEKQYDDEYDLDQFVQSLKK